ncbi:MAG: hypothetical protein HZB26_15525 [Candidatus Hydrogenedentes bacterium]|nr:hypothetical protein [Candidatus Hydrogenedentota bacterium]
MPRLTLVALAFFSVALILALPGVAAAQLQPDQEAALNKIARGQDFAWTELTPQQAEALHAKAEAYLENYQKVHQPQGLEADILWADRERTNPLTYEGIGDSITWTGHYLAALALRYHVTHDPKSRADMLPVLDSFDLLITISGRDGYITRYTGDAEDAAYRNYYSVYGKGEDPERPGLGKSAYRGEGPYGKLVWLGNSSRDVYDGAAIGLATVWVYVADPEIHARVKKIIERIADRLIADDWYIVDGKGHRTRPTPSFKLEWMRLALTANPERFAALQETYNQAVDAAPKTGPRLDSKQRSMYFPANLDFIRMFVLATLEPDPAKKTFFQQVIRDAYTKQAADHLNAHFAALYMTATGDTTNANARATLQGALYDFPDPPKMARAVDHRNDPKFEMDDAEYTKYAMLPHDRLPHDFIWQRSPCLAHGSTDAPLEYPGIDVFLPYWLGRVSGAIPAPTAAPAAK